MHVLVTGGCGYVGSALVPRLQADGHRVTVLDSLSNGSPANLVDADLANGLDFVEADVRDYGAVEAASRDADAVVHLAAITGAADTHDRETETHDVNLEGTRNVLTAAEKIGVDHLVFASSCNVYGRATEEELDETTTLEPINPYAETKLAAERLLAESAMPTTALRLSTLYGYAPGIRFNLVVNGFVFRALTDRQLTVYGDGRNWRPFIHVEDAAGAFADALRHPGRWPHAVYNVGANAENYRIHEIADAVADTVGTDVDVTYLEDKRPGPSYHVSFDRLDQTGYAPDWTLEAGVRDLIERFTGPSSVPTGSVEPSEVVTPRD